MTNSGNSPDWEQTLSEGQDSGKLSAGAVENITRWMTEPQYAAYRDPILRMMEVKDFERLDLLFWEVIPFGTGGRRGLMAEVGSATVNERTIAESAHGMATYLKQERGEAGGKAVIAHDTRHRSREFAELTARVFAAHGLKVDLFDDFRSTPALSFAVRHLGCDIGVMISASHNPPSDNGFKAYWSHGGQVLFPHDKGIIDCVYQATEIPMVDLEDAIQAGGITIVGEKVDQAYADAVMAQSLSDQRDIAAMFTPLHGVGATSVYRILQDAGFTGVQIFEPQANADSDFTNVPDQLPNPERPEVFEPAIEAVAGTNIGLILASDPDADRLGVSVKDGNGQFQHLTGNRIGALIADYVTGKKQGQVEGGYVVETLVTTPLIAEIAKARSFRVINDLLVGFKYIGQTMDEEGPDQFVFGAEESLGYLAGQYARDKDAGIAALLLLEFAAELQAEGKTLLDRLEELYGEFGYFFECQKSQVRKGSSGQKQIGQILDEFRNNPPSQLGDVTLTAVRDYQTGEKRTVPENSVESQIAKPEGNLLIFEGRRGEETYTIAVRPSGTEPKIKYYSFARTPKVASAELPQTKQTTEGIVDAMQDALIAWVNERVPEEE
ncbi:phospho-sugar mutase [Thalassoroseus pseudoceratinae]|uniref:phospho-sugar mutase n=1 Tax=Thalassoroseus pseudoceratinae TaxID=2713176 RepID=UPI001424620C|nr:phospho-sugar mutase [Thalassoroseus pseudoceratinae]